MRLLCTSRDGNDKYDDGDNESPNEITPNNNTTNNNTHDAEEIVLVQKLRGNFTTMIIELIVVMLYLLLTTYHVQSK